VMFHVKHEWANPLGLAHFRVPGAGLP